MRSPIVITLIAAAGLLVLPGSAGAEVVAYIGQANTQAIPPLQSWGGSLGMDFTVNSAISVDSMGVFNAAGNGVITGTLQVAIFTNNGDGTGTIVAGTQVSFAPGTYSTQDLVNDGPYDVYQALASSVILNPGNYSVVAVGFSGNDPNGNSGNPSGVGAVEGDTDGLITYTGSSRYNQNQDGNLVFPTTIDGGPGNRYDAGTFEFSATPEPGTFGMLLSASGLLILGIRKKAVRA
jgi:hypothetical protein